MACTETYVTLRIFSKENTPDEISRIIGIKPTEVKPKELDSKYKHLRENNFWSYSTEKISNSTNNIEHLEIILNLLAGKEATMKKLRGVGCSSDIFCFYNSTGQGGPYLDVDLMTKLVRFGLDISWDIYFDYAEQ